MANVVGSSVCRTAVDEGKPEDWVPGGEKQTAVDPMKNVSRASPRTTIYYR